MSIRKRGGIWWIDIRHPNGRDRIRRSARTSDRVAAQELHDTLKSRLWREAQLGERRARTWDEAAARFLLESEHKASIREYARHVAFWTLHFRGLVLEAITRDRVAELVEAHAKTPATRNRYAATLRAVLRKAAGEWEWTDKAPTLRTYDEPDHRVRWLSRERADALLSALPPWLRAIARFALWTGLRQGNVLRLEWSQVDLAHRAAWIHADQAKARSAIGVPLSLEAVDVVRGQIGKHQTRVFVDGRGRPIDAWPTRAQKAWEAACAAIGEPAFRFHDLRHTWASWHAQRGTPEFALQALGGWKTAAMVRRYAHLAIDHLRPYAEAQFGHSAGGKEKTKIG